MLIIPQIEAFRNSDPKLYEALKKLNSGINTVAVSANVDANRPIEQPSKIDSINVVAADGIFDVAIKDNTGARRGLSYFVESSVDIGFSSPVVYYLGPTRNMRVNLGNLTLYWRAYSQYPGSSPSTPVVFGAPTAVVGGGAIAGPPPNPSEGSGSGSGSGSGTGGNGYGPPGCTEIGTPLGFLPGAQPQIVVDECSDWVDIDLKDGRRLGAAKGTLVSCFVRAEDLAKMKKALGYSLIEVERGKFVGLRKTRRSRRQSMRQKVTEPVNQVYYGNGVRLHNSKISPERGDLGL